MKSHNSQLVSLRACLTWAMPYQFDHKEQRGKILDTSLLGNELQAWGT